MCGSIVHIVIFRLLIESVHIEEF